MWRIKTTALEPNAPTGVNGAGVWGGLQLSPSGKDLLFAAGNTDEKPLSKLSESVASFKSADGTLGSNLTISGDAIYCGTGVPQLYGGYPKRHGVFKVGLPVR